MCLGGKGFCGHAENHIGEVLDNDRASLIALFSFI